ncbi:transmembrane protein [Cystoisospora suis]|uniref:Transmembrane protein n=1 Tax=Cystoisospora suis TaxID=483139 RepID=A0A2C6L5V1_9APIC|nr:transmembrane protein [Cystoisospora suis]
MSSLLVGEEEEIKKRIRELFFLQGREVEEGDFLLLLWSSRMIDMSLLEFFFGILNYMSIALASILQLAGETYHFKVHHVFLSTLNACCFFYFFGIPFCRPFGGPMLNAGYAALVTSYRLDLIGFLIFVSVDLFSAYISARYLVRPSFLSSSSYPSFSAVERERRRKERKEEKETGDLQDDRDDGDVCEEKERRGLFSRFFLGKKRQKVEDEKNKKKRSLKKTE